MSSSEPAQSTRTVDLLAQSIALERFHLVGRVFRKIEYAKAQIRSKVEYPFRVIKRQFGYTKVWFRRLVKTTARLTTLFALSNLWMARKN